MLDRPIAAFDIETMPDPDYGRRVLHLEGDSEAVVHAMTKLRLEETDGRTEYPQQPAHRIVAICVARLDPAGPRFELEALGDGAWDEASQLRDFAGLLERAAPRLASWNGNGFDLPIIRYRAMAHGLSIPDLHRTDGEWKWNNYANRFHTMHVDLMDVLSGFGASPRAGLGLVADVLGLPSQRFLDAQVYEHILRGEEQRVREYYKLDVVTTLLAYLRWCVLRGDLDAEGEDRLMSLVREGLSLESYARWAEVATDLPIAMRQGPVRAPVRADKPRIIPFQAPQARLSLADAARDVFANIVRRQEEGAPKHIAPELDFDREEYRELLVACEERASRGEAVLIDPGAAGAENVTCRMLVADAGGGSIHRWGSEDWRVFTEVASKWTGRDVWFTRD